MAASLHPDPLQLVCDVDTPAALRAAVDAGADAVLRGVRDAGPFPADDAAARELADGVRYARRAGARVVVAVESFARPGALDLGYRAVDRAAAAGADAIVVADVAVLDYAARTRPELARHLSARAAARTPEAIRFYRESWGVRRVVLPRGLTVEEISRLDREIEVETEAVVAAASCVMAEGRCRLSSGAAGCPPPAATADANDPGACADGVRLDHAAPDASAAEPLLCTGVFKVAGEAGRLFAAPPGLATATLLGGLQAAGVTALRIEGGGEADTAAVVGAFRRALDAVARGKPPAEVARRLAVLAEGGAAPATAG